MPEPVPILEFRRVRLASSDSSGNRIAAVSLILGPGSEAVVQTAFAAEFSEEPFDAASLADAAEGLLACDGGQVLFSGRDWALMPPLEQARNRGRIGRLFEFHGWVYNLSVMENLLLACQTHGRAADAESEAEALVRRFGLAGIPEGRPVLLRKHAMRLLEWVRAFVGHPELIILERPELDMPRRALDICFELAQEARSRGAALLWITHDGDIAERVIKAGGASYWMQGSAWRVGRRTT